METTMVQDLGLRIQGLKFRNMRLKILVYPIRRASQWVTQAKSTFRQGLASTSAEIFNGDSRVPALEEIE